MRCIKCNFLDVIKFDQGKTWKCPNCEYNQPERSKREDLLICPKCKEKSLLERCSSIGIGLYYRCYNCYGEFLEKELIGCGALNTMET
jgi:ribosomal protein L37AE/L43A